ncbi:hypothetical protein GSI_12523 [Ganoderma sinense ZZ0214-1]|uniref:BTB domain-containing protein n=1 Tax=Ganoderma sinense ZZ0214-1 TaxID=1077348 RepID=A0A2G8RT01_9APHY|nr:hypothetical protein GSI_12523 [Ganoderma sinense ZZ0214-1]
MSKRTKSEPNNAIPESTSQPSLPTVAPHPFNHSSADITLRTPNRVDFYIHSPILSQASPVFADMLTLPQPSSVSRGAVADRPVVDVTEDSRVLERLMRLCYPIEKEKLDALEDIVPVLEAAMKYDMKWPISLLTTDLLAIIPRSPLKVWAVACRCGLETLASEAAASILRKAKGQTNSQSSASSSSIPALTLLRTMLEEDGKQILHGISAADYFRLREYLRAGGATATTKLLSPSAPLPACEPCLPIPTIPQFPPSDIILRSPDGTENRVHTLLLMLHSPILGKRIRTFNAASSQSPDAQGTDTCNDPLPTLEVDIDSLTLSTWLAALYRGNSYQLPSDLSSLGSMLVMARRFGMEQLAEAAEGRWHTLAASSPLEAYFVASKLELTDFMKSAARKALEGSIAGAYVPAMESNTALAYHRLLEYYRTCASTIDARMKTAVTSWNMDLTQNPGYSYSSSYCSRRLQDPTYVTNTYLSGLATGMDTDSPGKGCSFDLALPALLRQSSSVWPSCNAAACKCYVENLMKISAELPQVLADAITEVQLEIE